MNWISHLVTQRVLEGNILEKTDASEEEREIEIKKGRK